MGVPAKQQDRMFSFKLSVMLAILALASADQTLEWTITGEPFEVCLQPGEKLTFEWEDGHNVERVSEEGYEDCSGFKSDEPVPGPFDFKTSTEGTYYFVCGVGATANSGSRKLSSLWTRAAKYFNLSYWK